MFNHIYKDDQDFSLPIEPTISLNMFTYKYKYNQAQNIYSCINNVCVDIQVQ